MASTTPDLTLTWTKEELYRHLQMAIEVEFYTIPLYLTAAYSVKPASQSTLSVTVKGKDDKGNPISESFPVYDTVFSVAIQEMYHLMWVCNVAKSVGMPINIPAPDMTTLPATLNLPKSIAENYKGPANLIDVIDLLVAIETPDPKYGYPVDPTDPITKFKGPIFPRKSYKSIGDLYHAISYGLNELFPSLNQPSYANFQKIMIKGSYPGVPVVTDLNSALNAIGAIVEEGEGSGVEGFIPIAYQPQAQDYDAEDAYTHYERFLAIQEAIGSMTDDIYPTPSAGDPTNANQESLTENYSLLLQGINSSYALQGDTLNTPGMSQVGIALAALWNSNVLPAWTYKLQPQAAPLELHVCQGLNACAGHGANGSGTMPGDGDCATVSHTCQSSNDCHSQGACGFPGQATKGGAQNVLLPGENACKGLGGCESPISVWQVFSDSSSPLNGKYVWCEARSLFETRMASLGMQVGLPTTAPSAIRLPKGTNPGSAPLTDNTSCPTSSTPAPETATATNEVSGDATVPTTDETSAKTAPTAASTATATATDASAKTAPAAAATNPHAAAAVTATTLELHVCQGLNSCAGHGANGSGTMPGDGDCATVSHTCQASNDCNMQGACGFPGQATKGGAQNVLLPGENACKGLGGCESPISVWQVFSESGSPLNGKYVWCEARSLFETRMASLGMQVGKPTTAPSAIRLPKGTNPGSAPLTDNTSCPTS